MYGDGATVVGTGGPDTIVWHSPKWGQGRPVECRRTAWVTVWSQAGPVRAGKVQTHRMCDGVAPRGTSAKREF